MTAIGFTGTRKGMTDLQKVKVPELIFDIAGDSTDDLEFHHGVCEGADIDFHTICRMDFPGAKIIGWPGVNREGLPVSRGNADPKHFEVWHDEMFYLARDAMIVSSTDILIATPKGYAEERRSGTWATVRMARGKGLDTYIVFPDGSIQMERIGGSILY